MYRSGMSANCSESRSPRLSSTSNPKAGRDRFEPGQQPELDQVRDAVRREWEHDRHQQLTEAYYQRLIDKYEITIDWPQSVSGDD